MNFTYKILPYPDNLVADILNVSTKEFATYNKPPRYEYTVDIMLEIYKSYESSERFIQILEMRYKDKLSYSEIARRMKPVRPTNYECIHTDEHIRQMVLKALRVLRFIESNTLLLHKGFDNYINDIDAVRYPVNNNPSIVYTKNLSEIKLNELELSVRASNALHRRGMRTAEDISKLTRSDLLRFRNLGESTADEICKYFKNKFNIIIK